MIVHGLACVPPTDLDKQTNGKYDLPVAGLIENAVPLSPKMGCQVNSAG